MIQTRKEIENLEYRDLAPYAVKSGNHAGRTHPEEPHPYRSAFQRDRDRVIHSRCFRRLEYKTQVFVNGTADHYRTRLTHTFEMAAVSRTLARVLCANEDLAESIALAHDIGHSPFGHCGEEALNGLMRDHGGFDHNLQSARWVETLEPRYPGFGGLNLTWEVRAGLRKHLARLPGEELDGQPIGPHQQLEAQIADFADDITYHAHDVDDGLEAGLLTEKDLESTALWRHAAAAAARSYGRLDEDRRLAMTVRSLLDVQVEDILHSSSARIDERQPSSPADVMTCAVRLVTFSPEMEAMQKEFHDFLFANMYFHPDIADANRESAKMMSRLFTHYVRHPEAMGQKAQARIEEDGLYRAACDYVSGMTDRYACAEVSQFGLDTTVEESA